MGVIFRDEFTEASTDTALTAHTVTTGTNWTQVFNNTSPGLNLIADASSDACRAGSQSATGHAYQANPSPTTHDYDFEMECQVEDGTTNTRPFYILFCYVDNSNYYILRIMPASHATDTFQIHKVVAGATTQLDTDNSGLVATNVVKGEVRGTFKRILLNGTEILTTTDTDLAAPGAVCLGAGRDPDGGLTGNLAVAWFWDNFQVTEINPRPNIVVPSYAVQRASRW